MGRTAIHPGEHVAEQLKPLGMSAAALGARVGVPAEQVVEMLKGKRGITADTAVRLAGLFHTSPEFWLKLQALYDRRSGKGRQ